MKDKIETIIQGKRHVVRAVRLVDGNVAYHIYDYPYINDLPESRIVKLANELGLSSTNGFVWYGLNNFEDLRTTDTKCNCIGTDSHLPIVRVNKLLNAYSNSLLDLKDEELKHMVNIVNTYVETKEQHMARCGTMDDTDDQKLVLSLLGSLVRTMEMTLASTGK